MINTNLVTSPQISSSSVSERVEYGTTVADALRFLKKAKRVYVTVPIGYDGTWDYFRVSKADAQRYLTKSSRKPADPFSSNISDYGDGDVSAWLGSYNDMRRHDAKAAQ